MALGWGMPLLRQGHLGVPMFFVLSGYCLMASVRTAVRDGESTASFLGRRFLRIFPPYWFSIAVVASVPFIIEGLSAWKTGHYISPSASGNINLGYLTYTPGAWLRVLTLTQVFASVPGATNLQYKFTTINAVYWTLAIEFQFYLLMAVALALRSRALSFIGGVTLASAGIWLLGIWGVSGVCLPYWPMFAVGILLFLIIERGWTYRRLDVRGRAWLPLSILVGVFVAVTIAGHQTSDTSFAIGFGVTLWCLHALDDSYRSRLSSPNRSGRVFFRTAQYVGLMSYSLYLLHGRVQFLALQICRQVASSGLVQDALTMLTTCLLCYAFYVCFERPFIRSRVAAVAPSAQLRMPAASTVSV